MLLDDLRNDLRNLQTENDALRRQVEELEKRNIYILDMMDKRTDIFGEAVRRVSELEAKLEQAEAEAAAMREALLNINELGDCDKCGQTYILEDIAEVKHTALATTAGAALLERMRKMEKAVEAAREWYRIKKHYYHELKKEQPPYTNIDLLKASQDIGRADDALDAALADYEKERSGLDGK